MHVKYYKGLCAEFGWMALKMNSKNRRYRDNIEFKRSQNDASMSCRSQTQQQQQQQPTKATKSSNNSSTSSSSSSTSSSSSSSSLPQHQQQQKNGGSSYHHHHQSTSLYTNVNGKSSGTLKPSNNSTSSEHYNHMMVMGNGGGIPTTATLKSVKSLTNLYESKLNVSPTSSAINGNVGMQQSSLTLNAVPSTPTAHSLSSAPPMAASGARDRDRDRDLMFAPSSSATPNSNNLAAANKMTATGGVNKALLSSSSTSTTTTSSLQVSLLSLNLVNLEINKKDVQYLITSLIMHILYFTL